MKIKKPMSIKSPAANASGGATIADRFKLETLNDEASKGGPAGTSVKLAFAAGFVSLLLLGGIVWFLYKYYEFQKLALIAD